MKNNSDKIRLISLALFIVPFMLCLLAYPKLPDVMGTHFDFNGNVNGTMNKFMGSFGVLAFMVVIHCITVFIIPKDPKYKNIGTTMRVIMFFSVPVITTVTLSMVLCVNLGYSVNMNLVLGVLLGVLFIVLGNYLPKTKRNYTVGIKIPWTLDDDDNWNKTHRIGGYCFMLSGVIMIVCGILNCMQIALAAMFVCMIIPFVYSYMLYRKKNIQK